MPVYNEEKWIETVVNNILREKVLGIDDLELIIVDDGSTDKTKSIIEKIHHRYPKKITPIYHKKNSGKGAALRSAIEKMSGDVCIIQDADLEYNPSDYANMLEPFLTGKADCVYGSRFITTKSRRILFFWHYLGNKMLTFLSNLFTNLNLTDMECCYKVFRCDLLKGIKLSSNRFGFEPEITAKIARRKCRIYEVGISYNGRTYAEGKKITWVDGVKAIYQIIKYRFVDN